MKTAYIYPISAFMDKTIPNPYMENFMDGLKEGYTFVNKDHPSQRGILDLMKYIRGIDTIFLNWIEDLPDKRGGLVQTLFFILIVFRLKIRKIKIVWVLHNKKSHYGSNWRLKSLIFWYIMRRSDLILTHSKEGLDYLEESGLKNRAKARYFPHPLTRRTIEKKQEPSWDILLWGSIIPYKGIDRFLQYLYDRNLEKKYRILVAGKVKPPSYVATIKQLCNENIHLDNRYVPENEIIQYMADSRAVLFTYSGESILSSGALMDSLAYGLNVIGPHVAAFRDAKEDGVIETFTTFEDLVDSLDTFLEDPRSRQDQIDRFIDENNWGRFSQKLMDWIDGEK